MNNKKKINEKNNMQSLYNDLFYEINDNCLLKLSDELRNKLIGELSIKLSNEKSNEVWDEELNKKLEEKFCEASMITEKSKIGDEDDESEVEEIFNTPVIEKYSSKKFSLEEKDRIFYLVKEGLNKCQELDEDFYLQIKDFKYLYYVYNCGYRSLDCKYKIR